MDILIKTPSFAKHGGVRVLIEHANGLAKIGHSVCLQSMSTSLNPEWIAVHPDIEIVYGKTIFAPNQFDVIIAGSPLVAMDMKSERMNGKQFMLLQMCEELFNTDNKSYVHRCIEAYRLNMPIIGISQWNKDRVMAVHGRNPDYPYYIIGNGVSDEFSPGVKDDEFTILVEAWIGYNHAKDIDAIGPKVAKRVKEKYGVRVLAYSQFPKDARQFGPLPFLDYQDVPDEYYHSIGTDQIVSLNQRAHLLIKASKFDARSCAPVEAMKCGTPTARAIEQGDDDLIHGYNCLRCEYDEEQLFEITCWMIEDEKLRKRITDNGLEYAKENLSWERWTKELEKIISA